MAEQKVFDNSTPPGHEWYLAIGSVSNCFSYGLFSAPSRFYLQMMNPISLSLRSLTPVRSYPVRVPQWKLVFLGFGG